MITTRARRIAFCGHHNAGKDESAKFLCRTYEGCRYGRSISYFLAEAVSEQTGVSLDLLRGDARHAWADDFFRIGEEVRDRDPGHFARKALAKGNIITGIRDHREIEWGRDAGEIDLFVWVDRPVPPDPTMRRYGPDLCDVVIRNHGTVESLYARLRRWADFSGFVRLDSRTPAG